MNVGLCMVVRDEAHQLDACLAPVIDRFDQVVIVDTGSRDGTPQLLRDRFGIEVVRREIDESRCGCLCDARHDALERLAAPWAMLLDADERITPAALERIRAMPDDPTVAGYFGRWLNRIDGEPDFDDYKLFLFRRELRPVGLVHDVVQHDIRARGLNAAWLGGLDVLHLPAVRRRLSKAERYRQRLQCAMQLQPDFLRYHWFLGYMEFRAQRWQQATGLLAQVTDAASEQFPVESLNSAMVLAELYARQGDEAALERLLSRSHAFYRDVADDFEVRINFRLGPWLETARENLRDGRLDRIRSYRFAC